MDEIMNVEFIRYQAMAVNPTPPSRSLILSQFPIAAKCPPLSATLSAGLWLYPPFDADITVQPDGSFSVSVAQYLEAAAWTNNMERLVNWGSTWWCSKIDGVFQIDPGLIISTEKHKKLLITQPFNMHNRSFFTQTGVVDSDFFLAPFTINIQPALGVRKFILRRAEPVAQLIRIDKPLAELSFTMHVIDERPVALKFWRDYIRAIYGDPTRVSQSAPVRIASVYRQWRSDQ